MLKRNLVIIVIASLLLIASSQTFGRTDKPKATGKQPAGATVSGGIAPSSTTIAEQPTTRSSGRRQHSPMVAKPPSTTTAKPYIGGSEDGQSIKRKQPRKRQNKQPNAVQSDSPATPPLPAQQTKTAKPFVGGGEDGQSIKQKQPRHRKPGRRQHEP
ncbi:MAG: hypothetical protein HY231_15365 [Acidobacteria bacterium]|nr:hypothetical protein [Acidobacteriota bacterium]